MIRLLRVVVVAAVLLHGGAAIGATGTMGYTGSGASTITLEGVIRGQAVIGNVRLTPSATGDWDSINVYVRTTAQDPAVQYPCRCAIYDNNGLSSGSWTGDIIDSTAEFTINGSTVQVDARYSIPTLSNAAAVAGTTYLIACWSKSLLGTVSIFYDATSSVDSAFAQTRNYTTLPSWPNPATSFTNSVSTKYSLYAVYTITATDTKAKKWFPIGEAE